MVAICTLGESFRRLPKRVQQKVMNLYTRLYDFEELNMGKPPDEVVKGRFKYQKPIFEKTKSVLDLNREKVPPSSHLGQAFTYFLNQYDHLTRYLNDGVAGPDNGYVERVIRKFAIGHNNWMFSDTPEGGDASALLYSLVITPKINGVNPYKALTKTRTHIPPSTYSKKSQSVMKG